MIALMGFGFWVKVAGIAIAIAIVSVIVLLIVSSAFLDYMLQSLALYRDDPKVLAVSGYMWPVASPSSSETFFMPVPHYWGWGTWRRAWRHYVSDGVRPSLEA